MSAVSVTVADRNGPELKQWSLVVLALTTAAGLSLIGQPLLGGAVLCALSGFAIWSHVHYATYLFALLLYSNSPVVASRFHGAPSLLVAGVAGLLLIPVVHYVVVRKSPIWILPTTPLVALYIAWRVLSVTWASDKDVAVDSVIDSVGEGLILYLLLTNAVRSRQVLRGILITVVCAGAALGALSVVQQVQGDFRKEYGGFAQTSLDEPNAAWSAPIDDVRSAGPIGEKNYYAQFLLMLLPLAIHIVRTAQVAREKFAFAALGLLILAGIACTASRGAAVGFVAMVAGLFALGEIRLRHLTMLTVVAGATILMAPAYQERLLSMISAASILPETGQVQAVEKSLQGRISEMWAAAVVFTEHPLGGVGPGNFPAHFLEKSGTLGFQVHAEERMAHCSYLEIAAETGSIGLLMFLGILLLTSSQLLHARRRGRSDGEASYSSAFLLVLLVMMTTALFLSFAFERYYWFVLALAASAAHLEGASEKAEVPSPRPVLDHISEARS